MKNLKVTVNGTVYSVQVEEAEGTAVPAAPAAVPVPAVPAQAQAGGEIVESPMAGRVVRVSVAAGQGVNRDDALLALNTAGGEIELVAPRAASVAEVYVSKGADVQAGTSLVSLR